MSRHHLLSGITSAVCLSALPVMAAHAQDDTDPDVVVVVGATTNVDISAEDLQRFQANDLADIFRTTPSVSVGGGVGIAQKIYLRGLEDSLLNVTVDGAPQTGTLFHHIGRVQVEPELLEQVEVQAGAGEATAGFGAIGGAIRFRTRSASDLLEPGRRFGGSARVGYFSNEGTSLNLTGYGQLSDNWDALASFVRVDRENYEDGAGDEVLGTSAEQDLAYFKLGGRIGTQHEISLSYEMRHEEGELGQRPNWRVLSTAPLYPIEADRGTGVLNYRYTDGPLVNVELTAYSTTTEFQQNVIGRWGIYRGEVESVGFDLRNTSRFGRNELIYGVEYRDDRSFSEYITNPQWGSFEETGSVLGIYIQDHLEVSDALLLSFGARYDAYELDADHSGESIENDGISANVGARYEFTPDFSVTAGWAQAMRGKEVGDTFTLEGSSFDPNLDPERVTNRELGFVYDNGTLSASATFYVMDIEDVIQDQLGQGTYHENIGEYESEGVELQLGYQADHFGANLFYITSDSELNGHPVEGYEQIGLANSSGDRLGIDLRFAPTASVELGWRIEHVADLNNLEVLQRSVAIGWISDVQFIDKPGYTLHDVFLSWTPEMAPNVQVNLAVTNLFDELYRDHATVGDYSAIPGWGIVVGPYEAGRDIRASISARF